jgi:hypothetical protein
MRLIALAAIAAAVTAAAPAAAQFEKVDVNVSVTERNGICFIAFPRAARNDTDPPRLMLEFSVRARDGNFVTSVGANNWSFISGKDEEASLPMTLVFKGGKTTTSRSGGYSNGMEQKVWGGWGPGEGSAAALEMLKPARSVSVRFDGQDLGEFDLQLANYAHTWLTDCVARTKAAAGQ